MKELKNGHICLLVNSQQGIVKSEYPTQKKVGCSWTLCPERCKNISWIINIASIWCEYLRGCLSFDNICS